MAECRSCGAEIVWARTPSGKLMPLDPERVLGGTIELDPDEDASLVTRFVGKRDGQPHYVSHFATCPQASQHRRRGA
jgi:hypothetical protein